MYTVKCYRSGQNTATFEVGGEWKGTDHFWDGGLNPYVVRYLGYLYDADYIVAIVGGREITLKGTAPAKVVLPYPMRPSPMTMAHIDRLRGYVNEYIGARRGEKSHVFNILDNLVRAEDVDLPRTIENFTRRSRGAYRSGPSRGVRKCALLNPSPNWTRWRNWSVSFVSGSRGPVLRAPGTAVCRVEAEVRPQGVRYPRHRPCYSGDGV